MNEPNASPRPVDSANLSPVQRTALRHLLEAAVYARDVHLQVWEFAVCRAELAARGVTDSDLRWLISKGYLCHGVEQTRPGTPRRAFRRAANLQLCDRTCFVLTEAGERLALALNQGQAPAGWAGTAPGTLTLKEKSEVPLWDLPSHTLFWRGQVIKRYRGEAPYQETILGAFQEGHWVACVAVCLPADHGVSSKVRLHDTVKNLNRGVRLYLRFRQEGSGSRVRWEKAPAQPQRNSIQTLAVPASLPCSREGL